jgi:holin-like protein
MLKGIFVLLLCLFLGEGLVKVVGILIPGPVIGMLLLLLFLIVNKGSFEELDNVATTLLKYFALLFIPAAMGIITQKEVILNNLSTIIVSLFFGTLLAIGIAAKLFDFFVKKERI